MTDAKATPIVVIDDDQQQLHYVTALLTRARYSCIGFTGSRAALAYIRQHPVRLVITDIFMPDLDGFELLNAIRGQHPEIAVITLSGEGRMTQDFYLECAKHLGAVAALRKPFEEDTFRALVEQFTNSDIVGPGERLRRSRTANEN